MNILMKWSKYMLTIIGITLVIGCGDDNSEQDNSNGSTTIVEGVNVTNGKKIKEITFAGTTYSVEYDSKGRLSIIKKNGADLSFINYDSRFITWYENYFFGTRVSRFSFSLNTDGYISTIGTSSLIYDSNGYLTRVDEPSTDQIGQLNYNNNELIGGSISKLTSGKVKLFYITYGKKENEGNLYVHVYGPNKKYGSDYQRPDDKNVVCLIALQSGLFGKVPQSVLHFRDEKESSAFFEYEADDNSFNRNETITFVYQ